MKLISVFFLLGILVFAQGCSTSKIGIASMDLDPFLAVGAERKISLEQDLLNYSKLDSDKSLQILASGVGSNTFGSQDFKLVYANLPPELYRLDILRKLDNSPLAIVYRDQNITKIIDYEAKEVLEGPSNAEIKTPLITDVSITDLGQLLRGKLPTDVVIHKKARLYENERMIKVESFIEGRKVLAILENSAPYKLIAFQKGLGEKARFLISYKYQQGQGNLPSGIAIESYKSDYSLDLLFEKKNLGALSAQDSRKLKIRAPSSFKAKGR